MVRPAKRGGTKSNRKPMTVVVAPDGDTAAAKVDRMIGELRRSESTCRFLSKSVLNLSSPTSSGGNIYSFANIATNEDFASLSAQFKEWRVSAIRFEVYHVGTPSGPTIFSTFHTGGGNVATDEESVLDGEDSKYFEPGAGRQCFYWQPSGNLENEYQGITNYTDFGGLRFFQTGGSGAPLYAKVVVSCIILFRGRT
jgi:hypothetical protein